MTYKVIDWVTGLGEDNKLRYPDFDGFLRENIPPEQFNAEYGEAEEAVIESIRRNGYRFSGSDHQHAKRCMPLLDNGTVFFVSMRHWGELMFRAWHPSENDEHGYCKYAWYIPPDEERVFPNPLDVHSIEDVYARLEESEQDIAEGRVSDAYEVIRKVFGAVSGTK